MQTIAMVVPVPVRVVEDRVVFITSRGSRFDRAVQGQPISIQVEGRERTPVDGELLWSVVVSGICIPDDQVPASAGTASSPALDEVMAEASERRRWNTVPFALVQGWRAPLPRWPEPVRNGHEDGRGAG